MDTYESEPHALLGAGYPPDLFAEQERERRRREEFADTCCGKCSGDTCYVDETLGN